MKAEEQFKKFCADLNRFSIHFTLDDDSTEENVDGKFKKCKKCNRPTIDHEKPLHSKCALKVVDDIDELFDIEENIKSRQEFKEALAKLWEKAVNDEIIREKTTCYMCEKFCKTEIDLRKHKINFHKFTEMEAMEEETHDLNEDIVDSNDDIDNEILKEISKLKRENIMLENENLNLKYEVEKLQKELVGKESKVNILLDNVQTIITSFQSVENDLRISSNNKQSDKGKENLLKFTEMEQEANNSEFIENNDDNNEEIDKSGSNFSEIPKNEFLLGAIHKKYSCDKCSYFDNTKSNLQEHMKSHTLIKSKQCKVCKITFANQDDMKKHMETHIENVSIQCKYCDQNFDDKGQLADHIQVHHRIIYFNCEHCDEKFENISFFQEHKKKHVEIIKYSCVSCPKTFTSQSNLSKHDDAHKNKKYCHMYNNFQRCKYENSCLFLHEYASYCKFDGFCNRPSCHYKHKYGCLEKHLFLSERKSYMNRKGKNMNDKNPEKMEQENKEKN